MKLLKHHFSPYMGNNSTKSFHQKVTTDISRHAEHYFPKSELVKSNGFGDIYIYANNCCLTISSIFSNDSHVFSLIKNSNIHFVQDTLRNNHTKFHPNLFTDQKSKQSFCAGCPKKQSSQVSSKSIP